MKAGFMVSHEAGWLTNGSGRSVTAAIAFRERFPRSIRLSVPISHAWLKPYRACSNHYREPPICIRTRTSIQRSKSLTASPTRFPEFLGTAAKWSSFRLPLRKVQTHIRPRPPIGSQGAEVLRDVEVPILEACINRPWQCERPWRKRAKAKLGSMSEKKVSTIQEISSIRSLSALLSQVLVAFTVEFDNEFERRMGEAGDPGARLSLVLWANLVRFVGESGISVRDLRAHSLAPDSQLKLQLGCLERWRFVVLQTDPAGGQPAPSGEQGPSGRERRSGWGSGRGIRADWIVRLTPRGLSASRIWPPLFGEIEARWERRFGKDDIRRLRRALQAVAGKLELELPHGLPGGLDAREDFPPRIKSARKGLPLATLLSQLLLAFRLEFDRESPAPLVLCANTIRVLDENPIRAAEIPRLTGGSPETTGIGWQIKPYVLVASDPTASRGKVVRLSPRGLKVQRMYRPLIAEIEKRWEDRFGKERIIALREALQRLFARHRGDSLLLSEGLVPPIGTVRAGARAAALGRRDVGAAAMQRMRDLVAQTEAYLRDPAGALPHYPAWDMNRGFGP